MGKNPQIYADAFRDAIRTAFGIGKPNSYELREPIAGSYTETFFDYFGNSNLVIQTDNRQAFGATAKRIDMKQEKALNVHL